MLEGPHNSIQLETFIMNLFSILCVLLVISAVSITYESPILLIFPFDLTNVMNIVANFDQSEIYGIGCSMEDFPAEVEKYLKKIYLSNVFCKDLQGALMAMHIDFLRIELLYQQYSCKYDVDIVLDALSNCKIVMYQQQSIQIIHRMNEISPNNFTLTPITTTAERNILDVISMVQNLRQNLNLGHNRSKLAMTNTNDKEKLLLKNMANFSRISQESRYSVDLEVDESSQFFPDESMCRDIFKDGDIYILNAIKSNVGVIKENGLPLLLLLL